MIYEKANGQRTCWCGGDAIPNAAGGPFICVESRLHDPYADGRPVEIKRLYVAGPMSGYPEANYPAFNAASEALRKAGFEVANPADVHIETQHHYVDLLRDDLKVMFECQGVATLENWWESTGARNEVQVAGLLKMPVRSFAEWLALAPDRRCLVRDACTPTNPCDECVAGHA